ncbi:MAG: hypothetical protein ACOH1O_05905 [Flavobacterium sp.]
MRISTSEILFFISAKATNGYFCGDIFLFGRLVAFSFFTAPTALCAVSLLQQRFLP